MLVTKCERLRALKLRQYHGRWSLDFESRPHTVESRLPTWDELIQLLVLLEEDVPEELVVFFERIASFENETKHETYGGCFDVRPLLEGLDFVMPFIEDDLNRCSISLSELWKGLRRAHDEGIPAITYQLYWW